MEAHSIDLSRFMAKTSKEEMEQPVKAQNLESEAKMHYDKEDLIQFHELGLEKPLVKACSDLDFDHPTII